MSAATPDRPIRPDEPQQVGRDLLHGEQYRAEQGRASLLPRLRCVRAARRHPYRRQAIARRRASPPTQRASSTERNGNLRFELSDDSGKATVTSGVYRGTNRITDLGSEELKNGAYYDSWKAPRKRQLLSYCVTAEDASGNQSRRSCADIRVT